MKKWLGAVLIGLLAVPVTRLGLHYLSYIQFALVVGAVVILLLSTNALVNTWRRKYETRLAAILLSLSIAEQQEALSKMPEESRQRVLELMRQMAPNKLFTRRHKQHGVGELASRANARKPWALPD